MDIAQVDGTLEFTLGSTSNSASEKQREAMDLNETPFKIKEEHQARMKALSKTGNHNALLLKQSTRLGFMNEDYDAPP